MIPPAGPYAELAGKVRRKREASGLAAELRHLAEQSRQQAANLYPRLSRKRLWGLLTDAAAEADLLAGEPER